MKTFVAYGDPDNRTVCLRGDIEATHWATIFDDEDGRDVVSFSDGTVLEFDKSLRVSALVTGPAFRGFEEQGDLVEAKFKGVVTWVLFGTKTEMIKL